MRCVIYNNIASQRDYTMLFLSGAMHCIPYFANCIFFLSSDTFAFFTYIIRSFHKDDWH